MTPKDIEGHCKIFISKLPDTAEEVLKLYGINNMHADNSEASHIANLYIHIGIILRCIETINSRLIALDRGDIVIKAKDD